MENLVYDWLLDLVQKVVIETSIKKNLNNWVFSFFNNFLQKVVYLKYNKLYIILNNIFIGTKTIYQYQYYTTEWFYLALFKIVLCFTCYYVMQHAVLINLQNDLNFCLI